MVCALKRSPLTAMLLACCLLISFGALAEEPEAVPVLQAEHGSVLSRRSRVGERHF